MSELTCNLFLAPASMGERLLGLQDPPLPTPDPSPAPARRPCSDALSPPTFLPSVFFLPASPTNNNNGDDRKTNKNRDNQDTSPRPPVSSSFCSPSFFSLQVTFLKGLLLSVSTHFPLPPPSPPLLH